MSSTHKIAVLAEARYLEQSQPPGLIAALQAQGQHVTIIDPQRAFYVMGDDAWLGDYEVLVGRGRSWALLALLGWAETRGRLTINRRDAIAAVHNKAQMSVALAAADLPIPQTFFGSVAQLAANIPRASYPIILKPIFGDNSQGLLVIETPDEMRQTAWPEPVALAQRYFPTDGYDLKLYGIGDDIWTVRKPSQFNPPATDAPDRSGEIAATPELQQLGRRCGQLFGLDLFGVDCIETDAGVLVIEINDYPNYTGVPEGSARLADYVVRRAAARQTR